MFKSQKLGRNLFYFFLIFNLTICQPVYSFDQNTTLAKADSLFQKKKFTEAFKYYSELDRAGISTESMYLKMAYINEALNNVSETLYFLNKYYLLSKNRIALKKMENLASKYDLAGYDYSDVEYAENLVKKYGSFLNYYLIGGIVILLIMLLYQKFKRNRINRSLAIVIACFDLFLIMNGLISITKQYGIVNSDQSYVMNAPSSGAQLLTSLSEGNRFEIEKRDDIWTRIQIDRERGYVRSNDMIYLTEKQSPILWLIDQVKGLKKQ